MTAVETLTVVLTAAVSMGTPLLFATLGGVVSERSGVIHLGMEGIMLVSALTSFVVDLHFGSKILAVLAALGAAGTLSALHGVVCISLRGNQIASGLALALFGTGLSGLFGDALVGSTVTPLKTVVLPGLAQIPVLGPALFAQDALVYLSYVLVGALWFLLFRSTWGLMIRSVGEAPMVCDALGLSVARIRYLCVIGGGMLIGLGGAYFPLVLTSFWVDDLTAGRGWIAVALVIFSFWHPGKALWGAYLFGAAIALQLQAQVMGFAVPSYVLEMFPYLLTIVVLTVVTWRNRRAGQSFMPAALGLPFFRGDKH